MIKRIKPEELPEILDEGIIKILVDMCLEFPKETFHWANISEVLEERGELDVILGIVGKKRREADRKKYQSWWDSLSEDERKEEELKGNKAQNDPDGFYGNMGNPEYPE